MGAAGPRSSLDLQEQTARIDHLSAETQKAQLDPDRGWVEITKRQSDMPQPLWQVAALCAGVGAALFAAGAAFVKLLGL